MAHFMAVTGHRGEFPDDIGQQPAPDPAQFGMPADDDGTRNDVMLYQNIINTTQPDLAPRWSTLPSHHGGFLGRRVRLATRMLRMARVLEPRLRGRPRE